MWIISDDKRVQKFRSIEEMNNAPVPQKTSPQFEILLQLCARYPMIALKRYPPGIYKLRSIEETRDEPHSG